jgi:uncharacterized OB-fold protein
MPEARQGRYQRAQRQRRITAGMCVQCGWRPARPGRRMCKPCAIAESARRLVYYYAHKEATA